MTFTNSPMYDVCVLNTTKFQVFSFSAEFVYPFSTLHKPDLAHQIKALEAYCQQHSIKVDEWMSDIGSGLNYKRKHFNRLREMVELGQVKRIIMAHRDRLVRLGYDYFEAFCERHHTELVVINGENLSPEQELVRDLIAIVTVFSARLHGLRSYRKVLKDAALHKE